MSESDKLIYRVATETDAESITTLINSSYFGEESNQGWTNVNEMMTGKRTNTTSVLDMIADGNNIFLIFFGETDQVLKGCISLTNQPELKSAYVGMFAVRPDLQARGYGKFILSTAENYVVDKWNVDDMKLNVIMQKPELVAFYTRRDYADTGLREPFPIPQGNKATFRLLRFDLQVGTMSKCVKK